MDQLKLTNKELLEIGFKRCKSKEYEIKTLNGYFYYNPNEEIYTWYHKTIIGKTSNNINLDICKKAELYVLLQCFKVKFNIILNYVSA